MSGEHIGTLVTADVADWRAVANELASALRATMLRNPNLTSVDWGRASAALAQYDAAAGRPAPAVD
jgi:hypothetical protein